MSRLFVLLGLIAMASTAVAADDLLPPDQAYQYKVSVDDDELVINWAIEPGYYMYRHRFGFESATPGVSLEAPLLPPGKKKFDEFFGETEIYRDGLVARIPFAQDDTAVRSLDLVIKSQGCADIGICFPPQLWTTRVSLPSVTAGNGSLTGSAIAGRAMTADSGTTKSLLSILGGSDDTAPDGGFLPPDEAFVLTTDMPDPFTLRARFDIADGYYLYRGKMGFVVSDGQVGLGQAKLPAGKEKYDEFFGDVEVYYNSAEVLVPITRPGPEAGDYSLDVSYQGCAEDGICYPPITTSQLVVLPAASAGGVAALPGNPDAASQPFVSEQDRLAGLIADGAILGVMASFFGFGLFLAFTPCVLPMVPILSGIVVGQGATITTSRAAGLSVVYVLAMAVTYTVAGVLAGLFGHNLQVIFQNPFVIVAFSLVFVALALAMFGVYELQLPASLQTRLTEISNRQKGGTLAGVAVMGVLSALIVGPCVAAPLAAALIVIGQTGDPVRGGLALFALSLGMGAPLIAFGASAGSLQARAGAWMAAVRNAFGVMMLGVAIWFVSRIIPPQVTMLLWAALLFMTGVAMGALDRLAESVTTSRRLGKGFGLIAMIYGLILLIGGTMGGTDPLQPLKPLTGSLLASGGSASPADHGLEFRRIKSIDDLEREVGLAAASGRTAMLDFYADWCVSCKEMEKYTFTDKAVIAALDSTVLLQADVTANDAQDKALLKAFGIFGPPTIAFFGADGKEQKAYRVVGYMPADRFTGHVSAALSGTGG